MADDYQDLGTDPIFTWDFNWISTPKTTMLLSKSLIQQQGTVQMLSSNTDNVPQSFEAEVVLHTRQEMDSFLDFAIARKGKNERFWVFHPKQSFILKTVAANGATTVICQPNKASFSYEGYERLWVGFNDGDIITRKIFSITLDEDLDEMTLNLSTSLDRELNLTNHYIIGRAILVRFDNDAFDFEVVTDEVAKIQLRFFELVLEYDIT